MIGIHSSVARALLLSSIGAGLIFGCAVRPHETSAAMEGKGQLDPGRGGDSEFTEADCERGLYGWTRGQGVTRDTAPPCWTSSGGVCSTPAFEYVPGTGWCRPIVFQADHCESGYPGWIRGQGTTRDVAPPCGTSSAGRCDQPGFEYVRGTGWCKPIYFTEDVCQRGLPNWQRGTALSRATGHPCRAAVQGRCGAGLTYLAGTGWCQPETLEAAQCVRGYYGWARGVGITRDAAGPCGQGRGGNCASPHFEYVPGTGWCRPKSQIIIRR